MGIVCLMSKVPHTSSTTPRDGTEVSYKEEEYFRADVLVGDMATSSMIISFRVIVVTPHLRPTTNDGDSREISFDNNFVV